MLFLDFLCLACSLFELSFFSFSNRFFTCTLLSHRSSLCLRETLCPIEAADTEGVESEERINYLQTNCHAEESQFHPTYSYNAWNRAVEFLIVGIIGSLPVDLIFKQKIV